MTYWVIKHRGTRNYYTGNPLGAWETPRVFAMRFKSLADARTVRTLCPSTAVTIVRVEPTRKPADVATLNALATATALANEAGRASERERWCDELQDRARMLRKFASDTAEGIVLGKVREVCATQLDIIANALEENDPSTIELP